MCTFLQSLNLNAFLKLTIQYILSFLFHKQAAAEQRHFKISIAFRVPHTPCQTHVYCAAKMVQDGKLEVCQILL